jgi:hypothetical protein
MFIKRKVSQEQKLYAWDLVNGDNIANRKEWDGNKTQQFAGKLAEVCVADFMGWKRPVAGGGFDNGIDFVYREKNIDVKCVVRKVDFKEHFGCWVKESQLRYETDFYFFTSINTANSEITFIGLLEKHQVRFKGRRSDFGDKFKRDNGTEMTLETISYQITANELEPIYTKMDIFNWLDRRILPKFNISI